MAARVAARLPTEPLLVALSGGADSAVCAWGAREAATGSVRVAFVHHGLPASDRLAEAARAVAAQLDVPLVEIKAEKDAGPPSEGRLRAVRYAALDGAAAAEELVATGHTADDQAETVLGNLLRGAGTTGLAGIPGAWGRWVRPLLDVTRAETRELATLLGLPYHDDPANLAGDLRRNVLRRQVIPRLEAQFNPRLRDALNRLATLAAADDAELERRAAVVPLRRAGSGVQLPAALLATLPPPVAGRAVRRALRTVRGPHGGVAAEVDRVLAVACGEMPRAELTTGLEAVREGPWLTLGGAGLVMGTATFTWPGTVAVPGVLVESWVEDSPPLPWPLGTRTLVLDADVVGGTVELRPARPGERIDLAGGTKPVRTALAEAGVPARLRSDWPVVATRGRLAVIVGVRAADWARAGRHTRRFLWVTGDVEAR